MKKTNQKTDGRSAKERELEILRQMHEDDIPEEEKFTPASDGEYTPDTKQEKSGADKREEKKKADRICPKCGAAVGDVTMCPSCGYRGYMPMSENKIRRTRLILYPIVLVIALLVYLYVQGYFG